MSNAIQACATVRARCRDARGGAADAGAGASQDLRQGVFLELRAEPRLGDSTISVYVMEGVVILSGYVDVPAAADLALQRARRVPGVRGVVAKLVARRPDGESRPAAAPATIF